MTEGIENTRVDLLNKVSDTIEDELYTYFDRIKAVINLAEEYAGNHQHDDYHAIFALLDEESKEVLEKVKEIEKIVLMLGNSKAVAK